ncbi:hypothetical protein LPJ78_000127 [Coemansia sp. RSA 989]|nr:hypothetical protein LPJ79_000156 [Coemansia sp. RSA 1821]KAJ1868615.1 hypothetical protein LPJ78_000127 [Coemansia sp. RSA 989]KAJ2675791.1 hypothetical protein IWW42_000836 [Coemansia sp. RSA 1085]
MSLVFSPEKPPQDPAEEYLAHASDLLTQTTFSLVIGGTALFWFCLLRWRWPDVYAPRGRLLFAAPARIGKTFFGWILMVLRVNDADVMFSAGLDALLVLRLFRMLTWLSLTSSVVGLLIVVPAKVALDSDSSNHDTRLYDRIVTAALGSKDSLVVHFVFAYVFTALVYYYFGKFAYETVALRWQYLLRVRNTRPARSVMVTSIPRELAQEQRLKQHFEECGLGRVLSVEVVPRIERLGVLVRRRYNLLKRIEEIVVLILGNPCQAPGYDPDALRTQLMAHDHEDSGTEAHWEQTRLMLHRWALPWFHNARGTRRLDRFIDKLKPLVRRFHHADSVLQQVRHEWFVSYDGRSERSSTVGFVTFENASSAHLAAQSFTFSQPFEMRVDLASEPRDVFWQLVTLPQSSRLMRTLLSLTTYILMLLYWLTLAFLLSTLVSMDSLKTYFPWLPDLAEKNRWIKALFQYTTPTFMLSLMNACVPYILTWLARLEGIRSRSAIQESVVRRYYLFLLSNVLLIFTISRAVLADYSKWVENPALIPRLLATRLPTAAPFFLDYVILFALAYYPVQLLQFGSISLAIFRRMLCRTPREFADALRPNYVDWAFILPQPMLVFTILATYSSLAPFIFVLGAIYFTIGGFVTKYLLYYVYSRRFETAGQFILPVLKALAGSLWHYYVLIIGLCALKGKVLYVLLLLPLLFINWYMLSRVSAQFYENGRFVPSDMWNSQNSASVSPNLASSSQEQDQIRTTTNHPSHHTSTDYLQPRPHILSPFGQLLDAIDREYRGAGSWLWERARRQLEHAWRTVFNKIYVNPQKPPAIFRDLDRCYSLTGRSLSHSNYNWDEEENVESPLLASDAVQENEQPVVTPRFSMTFDDSHMRAELVLARDQRESRIEPDAFTDFSQSSVSLLEGVLDEGLAVYEHPYLISNLPSLWLPMKAQ